MKKSIILSFCLSFVVIAQAQLTMDSVAVLDNKVSESSGLVYFKSQLFTHNDSGDEPILYQIDTADGSVIRQVFVKNADAIDWEDITQDEQYLYIADIGNNEGNRTDLKIYRVSKNDIQTNDTVSAESIRFSYQDQTDFTPARFTTNFDAEALICMGDSLYILTKNWGNRETNIYALYKDTGTQTAVKTANFNAQGLVTAAAYNKLSNVVIATGYGLDGVFLLKISGFGSKPISQGKSDRYLLNYKGSAQMEAIASKSSQAYYLSSEYSSSGPGVLHRLSSDKLLSTHKVELEHFSFKAFPDSQLHSLSLEITNPIRQIASISVYNENGQLLYRERGVEIPSGVSFYQIPAISQGGLLIVKIANQSLTKSIKVFAP